MEATDRLLGKESVNLEDERLAMRSKAPGVKCDIVNECQMFIKAEDGSGDAHVSVSDNTEGNILLFYFLPTESLRNIVGIQYFMLCS